LVSLNKALLGPYFFGGGILGSHGISYNPRYSTHLLSAIDRGPITPYYNDRQIGHVGSSMMVPHSFSFQFRKLKYPILSQHFFKFPARVMQFSITHLKFNSSTLKNDGTGRLDPASFRDCYFQGRTVVKLPRGGSLFQTSCM